MNQPRREAILDLLPQTQCQLCSYADCQAYATAVDQQEATIDRCHPGGEQTLEAIAQLMQIDPEPYRAGVKQREAPLTTAWIDAPSCIGCTKCIQACPVDAILGAQKQLHAVLNSACTGCGLCLPPCPVDCIELIPHPHYQKAEQISAQSRQRYSQHQHTHQQRHEQKRARYQQQKKHTAEDPVAARKQAIADIINRKKQSSNES